LTFIIRDTVADAQSDRHALENVCEVLRSNGIQIDPDSVRSGGALRTMRTARGAEAEAVIARALLGPTEMTDQGVIYQYDNAQRGTAKFYSAGDFLIQLNEGVITSEGGAMRTVKGLLRAMQLETMTPVLSGTSGGEIVTVVGAYNGASIFNCVIEFSFIGDSLDTVKGKYATGIEASDGGAEISSAGTVLLGFLAAVRRGEVECSRIDSVEAGYQYRVSGSFGEGVIAPAWLIATDSGRYIIDDATGDRLPLT